MRSGRPQASLVVAQLEEAWSLVLRGGVPTGKDSPPYDFTWAFALHEEPDATTRLLVRERYAYTRPWARLLVEPVAAVSFVMSREMLRADAGHRAEYSRCPSRGARHRTGS